MHHCDRVSCILCTQTTFCTLRFPIDLRAHARTREMGCLRSVRNWLRPKQQTDDEVMQQLEDMAKRQLTSVMNMNSDLEALRAQAREMMRLYGTKDSRTIRIASEMATVTKQIRVADANLQATRSEIDTLRAHISTMEQQRIRALAYRHMDRQVGSSRAVEEDIKQREAVRDRIDDIQQAVATETGSVTMSTGTSRDDVANILAQLEDDCMDDQVRGVVDAPIHVPRAKTTFLERVTSPLRSPKSAMDIQEEKMLMSGGDDTPPSPQSRADHIIHVKPTSTPISPGRVNIILSDA